jgi:16S rRNA G1207 methylase RsmC
MESAKVKLTITARHQNRKTIEVKKWELSVILMKIAKSLRRSQNPFVKSLKCLEPEIQISDRGDKPSLGSSALKLRKIAENQAQD